MVVFDCTCNTQKFFVIEPTQRGWRTSRLLLKVVPKFFRTWCEYRLAERLLKGFRIANQTVTVGDVTTLFVPTEPHLLTLVTLLHLLAQQNNLDQPDCVSAPDGVTWVSGRTRTMNVEKIICFGNVDWFEQPDAVVIFYSVEFCRRESFILLNFVAVKASFCWILSPWKVNSVEFSRRESLILLNLVDVKA